MQVHYLELSPIQYLAAKLENINAILRYGRECETVIACWGAHGEGQIAEEIRGELKLWHLGLTKRNQPRHPLYLKNDVQPQKWV
jgi:hypothetical protein